MCLYSKDNEYSLFVMYGSILEFPRLDEKYDPGLATQAIGGRALRVLRAEDFAFGT